MHAERAWLQLLLTNIMYLGRYILDEASCMCVGMHGTRCAYGATLDAYKGLGGFDCKAIKLPWNLFDCLIVVC